MIFYLKREFRYKTRRIRHLLIKILSPTIFKKSLQTYSFPRPMIKFIKNRFKKKSLIGVEIGVYYGSNAKDILKRLHIKKLYLIDPYKIYLKYNGKTFNTRHAFKECRINLRNFKQQIKFILKESSEAINNIPDNLDFVYIDGNHSYNFIKKDIELYYPKVKKGGIFGGHDFRNINVVKAVMEFIVKNNFVLFSKQYDWWIIKK